MQAWGADIEAVVVNFCEIKDLVYLVFVNYISIK